LYKLRVYKTKQSIKQSNLLFHIYSHQIRMNELGINNILVPYNTHCFNIYVRTLCNFYTSDQRSYPGYISYVAQISGLHLSSNYIGVDAKIDCGDRSILTWLTGKTWTDKKKTFFCPNYPTVEKNLGLRWKLEEKHPCTQAKPFGTTLSFVTK